MFSKTLITNLTPKTYNWGSKQTKVPNYICAQRVKYILIPSIQQKSKLLYNKTLHSNKTRKHRILATSNTLSASRKNLCTEI